MVKFLHIIHSTIKYAAKHIIKNIYELIEIINKPLGLTN